MKRVIGVVVSKAVIVLNRGRAEKQMMMTGMSFGEVMIEHWTQRQNGQCGHQPQGHQLQGHPGAGTCTGFEQSAGTCTGFETVGVLPHSAVRAQGPPATCRPAYPSLTRRWSRDKRDPFSSMLKLSTVGTASPVVPSTAPASIIPWTMRASSPASGRRFLPAS